MLRRLTVALACIAWAVPLAHAQQGDLTENQKLGRQIVTQHCGVCHLRIQINTQSTFGPLLSKMTFENGREAELKAMIANGSPNMPGFKYSLTFTQNRRRG